MRRRAALSHYTDDSGLLSIDFIVGFTIFMISFIIVVTMASGLLIGLSSKSIDYDSVAYRTGVMLAEDPGWTVKDTTTWEQYGQPQIPSIARLGLALQRDTPNILSQQKVDKFFCSTYLDPTVDYNRLLIFGDYPYHFNITLTPIDPSLKPYPPVGEVLPDNYGYIRRVVMIKYPAVTIINASEYEEQSGINTDGTFKIDLNMPNIYTSQVTPEYQIDPLNEGINITIYNFNNTQQRANEFKAELTGVKLVKDGTYIPPEVPTTINGNYYNTYTPSVDVDNSTVNLLIDPSFLTKIKADKYSQITVSFMFNSSNFLQIAPIPYGSSATPTFIPAILEVRIW